MVENGEKWVKVGQIGGKGSPTNIVNFLRSRTSSQLMIGDIMFTGEHERLLDEKGRLVLPPTFRRRLVRAAFLTKSPNDPCLLVYSEEEIGKATERLIEQVQKNEVSPHAQRRWAASISEVRADGQGRIAVPSKLRNQIGLEREVILIGVINRAEIWTPDEWRNIEETTEINPNESQWL